MRRRPGRVGTRTGRWLVEGLGLEFGESDLDAIVLDGKVLRGTRTRHTRATMLMSALDRATGGDYLVIVKDNEPHRHRDARRATTVSPSLSPLRPAPRV